MIVPTTPPTVTTRGSATVAMQYTPVDDTQPVVEHSSTPTRAEGVVSAKTKFRPTTESVLEVTVPATLVRMPRALTTGPTGRNNGVSTRTTL